MRRTWTDEQELAILDLYRTGVGTKAIIEKYGGTQSVLLRMVKRRGEQTKPGGRRMMQFTDEQVAEMAELWQAGVSQREIGERFGCSQVVISRVLQQAGVRDPRERKTARGERHRSWKGGVVTGAGGYLLEKVQPDDPMYVMANRQGYVLQHRLRVARALGRPLERHETVHHVNGQRDDNRPANLQLRQGRHGAGVLYVCSECGSKNVTATILD